MLEVMIAMKIRGGKIIPVYLRGHVSPKYIIPNVCILMRITFAWTIFFRKKLFPKTIFPMFIFSHVFFFFEIFIFPCVIRRKKSTLGERGSRFFLTKSDKKLSEKSNCRNRISIEAKLFEIAEYSELL